MLIQTFNRSKDQGTGNGIALASLKKEELVGGEV